MASGPEGLQGHPSISTEIVAADGGRDPSPFGGAFANRTDTIELAGPPPPSDRTTDKLDSKVTSNPEAELPLWMVQLGDVKSA
jgi:hypothetical protein